MMFSPFNFNNNGRSEEEIRKQYLHLMRSPDAYEKEAFILRIKELESYIEQSWKSYNQTNESDYALRSAILREIDSIGISLSVLKTKHELWKQHRVTISK